MNFDLPEDILIYIADNVKSNIRQLEGVIKKLQAYSMIYDNITLSVAENAIRDIKRDDEPEPITFKKIIEGVSNVYNVSVDDIYSQRQDAEISHARQVAMYVIRKITGASLKNIGKEFDKDYSTVIYSCNKIEKLIAKNDIEERKVEKAIRNITGKSTVSINKAGIARTFQNIRLFKDLSVIDNIKVGNTVFISDTGKPALRSCTRASMSYLVYLAALLPVI